MERSSPPTADTVPFEKHYVEDLEFRCDQLEEGICRALDELGVPGPGYPAPVANAVCILAKLINSPAHLDGHREGE